MSLTYQEHDRELAVRSILAILRSPLGLMSLPDRNVAYALADFHKVTAADLLKCGVQRAERT